MQIASETERERIVEKNEVEHRKENEIVLAKSVLRIVQIKVECHVFGVRVIQNYHLLCEWAARHESGGHVDYCV